jgi:hypothetical protein
MNAQTNKGTDMRIRTLGVLVIFAALSGCEQTPQGEPEARENQLAEVLFTEPCAEDEIFAAWCGYKNPEDLAPTPDKAFLLATGFGGLPEPTLNEMSIIELSPMQRSSLEIALGENTWGDPLCGRSTKDFSSHGLDIMKRSDGKFMVAITNHLPKETVELFELLPTESSWRLVWRGCAESPVIESGGRQPMFNDVALTDAGGFYVTEMYNMMMPFDKVIEAGIASEDTGVVWYWSADSGFQAVAGSEGSFPNGIVINDDQDTLFINYWFSGETTKFDIQSGQVMAMHSGGRADNLTIAHGSLWAAKHDMTIMEYLDGCPAEMTNCFLPFSVHELDFQDLREKNSWRFNSSVFGFGTVAMPVGKNIWFGSAHGDRIARYEMKTDAVEM